MDANPYRSSPPAAGDANPSAATSQAADAGLEDAGDELRFRFQQSPDDLAAWRMEYIRRKGNLRESLSRIAPWIAALALCFLGLAVYLFEVTRALIGGAELFAPGTLLLLAALLTGLGTTAYRLLRFRPSRTRFRKEYAAEDGVRTGPFKVTISPRGIESRARHCAGRFDWAAIEEFWENEDACYWFTSAESCFLLPRRCFSSEEQFRAIAARAEGWREAARAAKTDGG